MGNRKEISRLLKKNILFKGDGWETIGTRKDRRHRNSYHGTGSWINRKRFLKKTYNKILRKRDFGSGGNYKKIRDYQRELY